MKENISRTVMYKEYSKKLKELKEKLLNEQKNNQDNKSIMIDQKVYKKI